MGIFGKQAEAAVTPLAIQQRGKSPEQKKVLEYFFQDDTATKKGCGCLRKAIGATITMDAYIAMLDARLASLNLKQRALEKLGIDESDLEDVEPICFMNYVFENAYVKSEEIKLDKKAQKEFVDAAPKYRVVASKYSVTWIFFSQKQLYTYNIIIDMTSDNQVEYMKELFYQDITALETETQVVERIKRKVKTKCFGSAEAYVKDNYTLDWFKVIVPGSAFSFSMKNAGEQAEKVMAAKALLRDRKDVK